MGKNKPKVLTKEEIEKAKQLKNKQLGKIVKK